MPNEKDAVVVRSARPELGAVQCYVFTLIYELINLMLLLAKTSLLWGWQYLQLCRARCPASSDAFWQLSALQQGLMHLPGPDTPGPVCYHEDLEQPPPLHRDHQLQPSAALIDASRSQTRYLPKRHFGQEAF